MSSQGTTRKAKERNNTAESPEIDDANSVDNMLLTVDQFVNSVYSLLNMTPPPTSKNSGSLNTSAAPDPSSTETATAVTMPFTTPKREEVPAARCNVNAEIERINQICDNVEEDLRSAGIFINSSSPDSLTERLSNANLTNSPTITNVMNSNQPRLNFPSARRQNRASAETAADDPVIDLCNSQAELYLPVASYNHDDDDVILVSANLPDVVDLCSPGCDQQRSNRTNNMHATRLNRRRLHHNNLEISSSEPPSLRRRSGNKSSLTPKENGCILADQGPSPISGTPFMCPVCMESFLRRQPTSTVCGHVFCKLCIEQAIAITRKCPMCNKKVSKKQTFRIYM